MKFYVVPTPLGNLEDITLRALKTLKEVDFVVCEHRREYFRLARLLNLPIKDYVECSKKNEKDSIVEVEKYLAQGKTGALVSDCGTPLFEDPGFLLLRHLYERDVDIVSLPGANCLITALPLSHFEIKQFYFAGFISQKKDKRERELKTLLKRKECVILLETPYRLLNLLDLFVQFAPARELVVPFNLTQEKEKVYRGKAEKIKRELVADRNEKGEFLVIMEGGR